MTPQTCTGYVVIVDDEEDTRELLRELLEARGYKVATASDGIEALDVLQGLPRICLLLLDLMMPHMDGFEVLKRLPGKSHPIPVWISTSAPDRAPPGLPCLPKPIDVPTLLSRVAEHCANEVCA